MGHAPEAGVGVQVLGEAGLSLVPVQGGNLVDAVWDGRPAASSVTAFPPPRWNPDMSLRPAAPARSRCQPAPLSGRSDRGCGCGGAQATVRVHPEELAGATVQAKLQLLRDDLGGASLPAPLPPRNLAGCPTARTPLSVLPHRACCMHARMVWSDRVREMSRFRLHMCGGGVAPGAVARGAEAVTRRKEGGGRHHNSAG